VLAMISGERKAPRSSNAVNASGEIDRIAVFSRGALEQVVPPLEIYRRSRTRFVGEFIGDSKIFAAALGTIMTCMRSGRTTTSE
jgi:ABC-type Fe3+/spermidine/putrescine transport system ATPase subunit